MLDHLKSHLKGKVVIVGIGNTMRSDDGVGSLLASRLKDKVVFRVFDVGVSPENYLEKIIKEGPDTILIIDQVDFGAKPGEFQILEAQDLIPCRKSPGLRPGMNGDLFKEGGSLGLQAEEAPQTVNLFATHNASISLTINYLQSNLKADIIILIIQPKTIVFGEGLSPAVARTLDRLENWFYGTGKEKG